MIVKGYFTSIESSKREDIRPKNLNVNINIDDLQEKGGLLEFSYTYKVNYQPEAGSIRITGKAFYNGGGNKEGNSEGSGESHEKILESWSKEKKIPPEVGKEVINSIMWNCSIQATNLAASMGLHPPVSVPSLGNKPAGDKTNSDEIKSAEIKSDDLRYFG